MHQVDKISKHPVTCSEMQSLPWPLSHVSSSGSEDSQDQKYVVDPETCFPELLSGKYLFIAG